MDIRLCWVDVERLFENRRADGLPRDGDICIEKRGAWGAAWNHSRREDRPIRGLGALIFCADETGGNVTVMQLIENLIALRERVGT